MSVTQNPFDSSEALGSNHQSHDHTEKVTRRGFQSRLEIISRLCYSLYSCTGSGIKWNMSWNSSTDNNNLYPRHHNSSQLGLHSIQPLINNLPTYFRILLLHLRPQAHDDPSSTLLRDRGVHGCDCRKHQRADSRTCFPRCWKWSDHCAERSHCYRSRAYES